MRKRENVDGKGGVGGGSRKREQVTRQAFKNPDSY